MASTRNCGRLLQSSAEYNQTSATQWKFKNPWLSKYLIQAHSGRPKIVGILVEFNEHGGCYERKLPEALEEVEVQSSIEFSLTLHGHIQCCPIRPARPYSVKLHYSWYAFLVLAALPLSIAEAWDAFDKDPIDVAADSLYDCEP